MIKLGSIVTDSATGLEGMVTHLQIELGEARFLRFQPKGLNPETGEPVDALWCVPERLQGGMIVPEPDLPTKVLGTFVEDMATGFNGTAVSICLHISGCVHVGVQPKGALKKTGAAIKAHDFDIRRLKGEAIPVLSEEQIEVDQRRKPSPGPISSYSPAAPRV